MSDLSEGAGRGDDVVARALAVALSEGGRSLARDPRRVHAMVNDILGAESRARRAEVDAVVLAVEEDIPAGLLADRIDADDARERLRTRGLDDAVAGFAIDAWRYGLGMLDAAGTPPPLRNSEGDSIPPATDPAPASLSDPGFRHVDAGPTVITPRAMRTAAEPAPSDHLPTGSKAADHASGPERDRQSERSRLVAVIAAVVAVVCLVAVVGVWLRGRSQTEDWKERALAAEDALGGFAPESDDRNEADADLTSAHDVIDDLETRLDVATSDLEATRSDLNKRSRELTQAQTPFTTGAPQVAEVTLSGTGQLTECSGFGSDGCGQERWFDGTMRHDGTQQLFDVDGTAVVPLTAGDGLTWTGSAAVTGEYNVHTCNGERSDTTMSVLMVPKEFRVDPTAQTIEVVSFDIAFSFSNPAGECTAATASYVGRFTSE